MPSGSEWCPLAKQTSAHCDKDKTEQDGSGAVVDSDPQSATGCSLIPAVFDKTRKLERDTVTDKPADKLAPQNREFIYASEPVPGLAVYTSYRPPGNKIFIKHRVFRI